MKAALLLLLVAAPLSAQATYRHHGKVLLPDSVVSPGLVASHSLAKICVVGYSSTQRHTSGALKAKVYKAYGVHNSTAHPYEIDHIISLELGGADSASNLFPQPYFQHPGAREKDVLENYLRREACAHRLPLDSAQAWLAKDWYAAYLRFIK